MKSNVYADWLRDSRGLSRDHHQAREHWFVSLQSPAKASTLFEFEMLLKGLAAFGNDRNVPGPQRRTARPAHDQERLRTMQLGALRCIELIDRLLESGGEPSSLDHLTEKVLGEDVERSSVGRLQLQPDTPRNSLLILRDGLTNASSLLEGLLVAERLPHRCLAAVHALLVREVRRCVFFDPLVPLEFRGEFDRVESPAALAALDRIPSEAARRFATLVFLSLFRNIRYLALVESYAGKPPRARLSYLILAAFRSDVRALTRRISRRAGPLLADGFEHELLTVPAARVRLEGPSLERISDALASLRRTLEANANALRVETRKVFEHDLPALEGTSGEETPTQFAAASAVLRGVVQQSIADLTSELPVDQIGAPSGSSRGRSDRLRRDVWIFSQILRAFVAKAESARLDSDRWSSPTNARFVHEFLGHFRAMGYQLVRQNDYERQQPLLAALGVLRSTDLLDTERLAHAARECQRLSRFLDALFHQIDRRPELHDLPFDKRAAADTLRVYLGAGQSMGARKRGVESSSAERTLTTRG